MKYRDIIKLLEADGWYWVSTKGSHQKFRHKVKPGTVIVPAHGLGADVKIGLEKAILKQAGLL
jgi:predicted RNA binding protein YcfA (HicA-like mRNA interferase family)